MSETVILHTERLSLRAPQARDAVQIAERIGLKDVAWNLGRAPYPYDLSDAEDFILSTQKKWQEGKACAFMLEHPKDGVIGGCGLDGHGDGLWEIGYWVGKPWWGQGFITEAASTVLNWGRDERGITKFVSGHFTDNPASGRVLTKLGFEPVGVVDHFGAARGELSPALRYTLGADPQDALRTATH